MATNQVTDTLIIKAPVEDLFAFYATIENLILMVPPELNLRVIRGGGAVQEDSRFLFSVRPTMVPFEVHWSLRVVNYEKNVGFEEELEKGPFTFWNHRHEFKAIDEETSQVIDTIKFGPPSGFAARVLSTSFITSTLEKAFRHRERVIRKRLEGATR